MVLIIPIVNSLDGSIKWAYHGEFLNDSSYVHWPFKAIVGTLLTTVSSEFAQTFFPPFLRLN